MRTLASLFIVFTIGLALATPARAQAPTATPTAAAPTQPVPPSVEPPAIEPYWYNVDGRRNPFLSLTGGATMADRKAAPKPTGAGIAGIRVDELSVRGIMQSRERLVAMVQGPDNRTYLIHQGDKLADGAVKSITPQGLVLVQDVSDPRAQEKSREVRKPLRSAEDEKE
ncbi:MAG: pilus assembly protein PilP [Vicinamibacterales bacterium]